MTNSAAPTALRVQPGSNGRFYVLDGHKVVSTHASVEAACERVYGPRIVPAPAPTQVTVRDIFPGEDEGNYAEYVLAMHEIADDMGVPVVRVSESERMAAMAAECRRTLAPRFIPYLDLNTAWGDADEMAMHAMDAWADRNRP